MPFTNFSNPLPISEIAKKKTNTTTNPKLNSSHRSYQIFTCGNQKKMTQPKQLDLVWSLETQIHVIDKPKS